MLPPDAGSRWRRNVNTWATMWAGNSGVSPNYLRQWGTLLAGLLQASPPTYDTEPNDPPVPVGELSELTEEAVPVASGLSAAFLRPVIGLDGRWRISVSRPTHVRPVWSHRQLVSAQVWDYVPYPGRHHNDRRTVLAIVEDWADGEVWVTAWRSQKESVDGGLVSLLEPVARSVNHPDGPLESRLDHPWITGVVEHDVSPRRIVPFVWAWTDNAPSSVIAGNENAVAGLCKLWTQEQEDAEMVRHRIAVSEDSLTMQDIYSTDGKRIIAKAGFNADSNVLALKGGMSAQDAGAGGVETITFPDSLVQRERIERRENAILEAIGINPQSIGRGVSGRSDSAAAKRADQQMTLNTISGPARRWQAALQTAVNEVHRLEDRESAPVVDIREGLKPDMAERCETVGSAFAADAMSARTRIAYLHPEWDDAQVEAEYGRLVDEAVILMSDTPSSDLG